VGRRKKRTAAAQTLGSMPLPQPKNAAAQNGDVSETEPASLSNAAAI
jgi:hypothetical protein